MNSTLTQEIGTAILNANMPSKFQLSYLQKTKALSSSKSLKQMPSLLANSNINAFKKVETKQKLQHTVKEKQQKKASKLQAKSNIKQRNHQIKKPNLESNKIPTNRQQQSSTNPQHFFARSHQFEKQKELKLQFQRRKQLYGVISDKPFHPTIIKKENTEEIDTVAHEQSEKDKSYKAMYYKKYGKLKLQEESKKKKQAKKYEQLMKESIQRFNQKFNSIGNGESGKHIQSNYNIHKRQIGQLSNTEETVNMTNIVAVEEKIKQLMHKLNLQDQINLSIQSIEELSRIQVIEDPKESQVNSSNLFNKLDQQDINLDQAKLILPFQFKKPQYVNIQSIQLNKVVQDSNQSKIVTQEQKSIDNQIQRKLDIVDNLAINISKENLQQISHSHNQQQKIIINSYQEVFQQQKEQKILPLFDKIENLQKEQLKSYQRGQERSQSQQHAQKQVPEKVQPTINQQIRTIQLQTNQVELVKPVQQVQQHYYFQDIVLLPQVSNINLTVSSVNFNSLSKSQNLSFLYNNQSQISIKRKENNIKLTSPTQNIAQIVARPIEIEEANYKNSPAIDKAISRRHSQQNNDGCVQEQSSQDTFQMYNQPFTDLNGNHIKGVKVEVKNFGLCRLLIADQSYQKIQ